MFRVSLWIYFPATWLHANNMNSVGHNFNYSWEQHLQSAVVNTPGSVFPPTSAMVSKKSLSPGTAKWDALGSYFFLQLFIWSTTLRESFCNLCQTPCLQGGQFNCIKPSYSQMNKKGWEARRLCRVGERKWHKSRGVSQTQSNRAEHGNSCQGNEICT